MSHAGQPQIHAPRRRRGGARDRGRDRPGRSRRGRRARSARDLPLLREPRRAAGSRFPRRSGRGRRPGGRQRRGQVDVAEDPLRRGPADIGAALRGRRGGQLPVAARLPRARDRGRLPGSGALDRALDRGQHLPRAGAAKGRSGQPPPAARPAEDGGGGEGDARLARRSRSTTCSVRCGLLSGGQRQAVAVARAMQVGLEAAAARRADGRPGRDGAEEDRRAGLGGHEAECRRRPGQPQHPPGARAVRPYCRACSAGTWLRTCAQKASRPRTS